MNFTSWPWNRRKSSGAAAHLATGKWGENQARRFLKAKGYRLLGRRVRVGRHDELDLVMRNDEVLVFVEVKTRRTEDFGRPASAVDRAKRRKLTRAAMRYMQQLRHKPPHFRFDIIEVVGDKSSGSPEIRHIENAFPAEGTYRVQW